MVLDQVKSRSRVPLEGSVKDEREICLVGSNKWGAGGGYI